jgi:guanylate kinase
VVRGALAKRPDVLLSVSATTRLPRAGEQSGVHYHFVPVDEFVAMRDRGELLEHAEVYGQHKGTPRRPVEEALAAGRDVLLEIDVQGARTVKEAMPEAILIFVEPPSKEELVQRLKLRGTEDPEDLRRRVHAFQEEMRAKGNYDHVVVNDRLEDAVSALLRILGDNQSQSQG